MDSKADLKIRNKKKILASVRENGEISKRDLQRILGLSWSTVSQLTSELTDEKYLCVSGKRNMGVGRCPEMLTVNPKSHLIIGVDVNIAFIRIAIGDLTAKIISKKSFPLVRTYDDVMEKIIFTIDSMMAFYGKENIAALAFAAQGYVDINTGTSTCIYDIENWRNVPLKQIFEEKYGLPVTVVHDNFAVMKAESVLGNTVKNSSNAMLVYYSKNIGVNASFLMNGEIYLGYNGASGEVGLSLVPSFKNSEPVILERCVTEDNILSEFIEDHPESGVNTFEELIEKAKSGEEEPLNAFKLFGKRLGAAVSNCINVLNPEIVVLAGIDSEYSYLYKKELLSVIRKYSGSASRKIILSKNNDDFTVIGAILTAIQKYCE